MRWKARVALLAAALWWGGLTAIGFVAVPLLFANLATPAIAGQMAAKLFTAQAYMAIACGVLILLATRRDPDDDEAATVPRTEIYVLGGLILALLGEFAVAPRIAAHRNLAWWHGLGTVFYGLQWICALAALGKMQSRG
jgi:hypothetical protein